MTLPPLTTFSSISTPPEKKDEAPPATSQASTSHEPCIRTEASSALDTATANTSLSTPLSKPRPSDSNPIIAASSELISLVLRVKLAQYTSNVELTMEALNKAYQNCNKHLEEQHVPRHLQALSLSLLSTWIEQHLTSSTWGELYAKQFASLKPSWLTPLSEGPITLIEQAMTHPTQYKPALGFAYLLIELDLDISPKHPTYPQAFPVLAQPVGESTDTFIERLYAIIREEEPTLYQQRSLSRPTITHTDHWHPMHGHILIALILFATIGLTLYLFFWPKAMTLLK